MLLRLYSPIYDTRGQVALGVIRNGKPCSLETSSTAAHNN